ncbi:TonB-dependent receptor [Aureisphaera galaxeae]|uniref:TonB-dependent receptor n=1 Tax=Aureisphaera galaxeae TaxID=1538023 RepID=UPI00234FD784|nr:TonB-dependent receptor [Aureisphaera galaxeae]MDC8006209.1 TonB-dependent receptor [Aureisphaera galaxeae]
MRLRIFLLACALQFAAYGQQCDFTLSGKVIDLHNNAPHVGAMIYIKELSKTAITNEEGYYEFNRLCSGNYTLTISHPECTTITRDIVLRSNMERTFRMEHHLEELNEVIVQGTSQYNKLTSVKEVGLSNADLERNSGKSLGDALNEISGVSSLNTGNTIVKPIINGLHSSRVTIINNGTRLEDQEWGVEHAPNIDINASDKVVVIKNAAALQYSGDAIGGAIILEPSRVVVKDTLFGKTLLTLGSNGRGGVITSQLTKGFESGFFGQVQGTLRRFGDFEAPDYVLSNTGADEKSLFTRFGVNRFTYRLEGSYSFFKNKIGILRASHLGGPMDQFMAINSSEPLIIRDFTYDIDVPRQEVTHQVFKLKGDKNFGEHSNIAFHYTYQQNDRLEFDIRRGDDAGKPSVDLNLKTHTVGIDFKTRLSDGFNFKSGIVGDYQENFPDPSTGVRRLIPDYERYHMGAYAIGDYEANDKLLVEAGIRLDYTHMDVFKFYRTSLWELRNYDELFPELVVEDLGTQVLTNPVLDFTNVSATAGVSYEFSDQIRGYFNYALASRAPNPSELFSEGLHHSASRIELGDLRFNSEVSNKFSLTLEGKLNGFQFTLNPYANFIEDFVVIEPTEIQQTIRGNFQVWEYRQTDSYFLGVDLDTSLSLTDHLNWESQFSLVKAYEVDNDQPLINIPATRFANRLTYENPSLNNLKMALGGTYTFRQNEFPNNNYDVFIPETDSIELLDISTPPDGYFLLNFSAEYPFTIKNKSKLVLGLSVENLLNESYRNYLNLFRFYADDLGRNILLNLKINY